MAQTAKKKSNIAVNPRSRAAKRATSPGIDVDKSLKHAARATDATPTLSGVRVGSGISKKRKVKHLTRGQRARQEKGLARAEAVMDQMIQKVDDSKSKRKRIDQRRSAWDDVNSASKDEQRKTATASVLDPAAPLPEQKKAPTRGDDVVMDTTSIAVEVPLTLHEDNTTKAPEETDLIT